MSKKQIKYSLLFLGFSIIMFAVSIFLNRSYFQEIAYDSTALYQLRQVLSLIVLFLMGYLLLYCLHGGLSSVHVVLFSFPAGICIWAFISFFLLLLGIPYTFLNTMAAICIMLSAVILFTFRKKNDTKQLTHTRMLHFIPGIITAIAFIYLVSTGFLYVFVSYDSYFYFTNYGNTLSIIGNFKDIVGDNSFTLTNISQFLPLLNAYTSFWGLDQCFQLQALLNVNVIVSFLYVIYQYACTLATKKRALICSALFTILLASSTSFIIISSWVLANMFCMAFIFFLFLLSYLLLEKMNDKGSLTGYYILISMFLTALALLRKDGIVFAAFFVICFRVKEILSARELACIFFPSAAVELWWLFYVRIVLDASVSQATYTSIANNKNVLFVCLIIIGTYLYLFIFHNLFAKVEKKIPFLSEYVILFAGMCVLLVFSFLIKSDIIIDNVDFTIRNMFRYPSSWGISAIFFAVLLFLSFAGEFRLDYYHFIWAGYAFLNFVSYCIVDNKSLWVNWDDSYNRVLLQIIPVFVFILAHKLLSRLLFDKQDHNCVS